MTFCYFKIFGFKESSKLVEHQTVVQWISVRIYKSESRVRIPNKFITFIYAGEVWIRFLSTSYA